jgi:hypothetical protein
MGNLNLPTPVALAGGAICVLGGYLLGVFAGPDPTSLTTATVASYNQGTDRLCLRGSHVDSQEGKVKQGLLCGAWQRSASQTTAPQKGDEFRFVSMSGGTGASSNDGHGPVTVIYGDVVQR